MSFTARVAFAVLGVLAALGEVVGGEVTLRVVDSEGRPLECWVRVFRAVRGNSDYASAFHGLEAKDVNPGVYNFELVKGEHLSDVPPPDHQWLRAGGQVGVVERANFFVIAPKWSNGSATSVAPPVDPPTLEGAIEPRPEGTVWIRFNAVYGDRHFDVDVDSSGAFRVWGDLDGRYLLTVIRGPEILRTQMVSFRLKGYPFARRGAARMVLKIGGPPAEIMRVEQGEK